MSNICIVEDEPKIAALLNDYLKAAGHDCLVIHDGAAAIAAIQARQPDLVLLDLMLPGKDGLEICRELRQNSRYIPIIMLTARVEEIDRLLGLELGADDYICKPFSPREVVARVKAVLRLAQMSEQVSAPENGLKINADSHRAWLDGQELELTPVEFRLLRTLAGAQGRIFSRDQLLDHLYEDHRVVTDRTVDSHVKNLRRKLEAIREGDTIRSIYGVGYRLDL
jgi:two-component system response regulator BaeR